MPKTLYLLMLSLLVLLAPKFAAAQIAAQPAHAIQTLESIQSAAEQNVRSQLGTGGKNAKYFVTASRLDSRLRLAACGAALETFQQPTTSDNAPRRTVGVRCNTGNAWTIYVSVAIEVEAPVLVLKRDVARLAAVGVNDVELQTRRLPGAATAFIANTADLQGKRLKRNTAAGTPLTNEILVQEMLVKRGQAVTLLAMSGTVEIRAQGRALTDGGVADRVRVQNVNSLKVVEGTVENGGTVRVDF